ncbi:MAG: hypothetical protein EPO25_06815 [Gammaproteobacteria bacterium]|nr:MAG: hypothetical protein EPO25_06815 [Gammaproteobacteria bacterium]
MRARPNCLTLACCLLAGTVLPAGPGMLAHAYQGAVVLSLIDSSSDAAHPRHYYLYLPSISDSASREVRLLISVHGTKSCFDDSEYPDPEYSTDACQASESCRARVEGYTKRYLDNPVLHGDADRFGIAVLSPQMNSHRNCTTAFNGQNFDSPELPAAAWVMYLVDQQLPRILGSYGLTLNRQKVFITGQSRGAQFVQTFARRYPSRVAAAAATGSGLYRDMTAAEISNFARIPFTVIVGTNDYDQQNGSEGPWLERTPSSCSRLNARYRRQGEAQKLVCCQVAQACIVSAQATALTPAPPQWHPEGATFSCDSFYNPVFGPGCQESYGEEYACPPPATLPAASCGVRFLWTPNPAGFQGHDGAVNYGMSRRVLYTTLRRRNNEQVTVLTSVL